MTLHGKNSFGIQKLTIRALPITFGKWRPCSLPCMPAEVAGKRDYRYEALLVFGGGEGYFNVGKYVIDED